MFKKILRFLPLLLIGLMALSTIGCGTQVPSGHRGVFFYKFGDGTEMGKVYNVCLSDSNSGTKRRLDGALLRWCLDPT